MIIDHDPSKKLRLELRSERLNCLEGLMFYSGGFVVWQENILLNKVSRRLFDATPGL